MVSECRGVADDIYNKSEKNITFKAGLLGFYTMSLVNLKVDKAIKFGLQSKASVGVAGLASMAAAHQVH